MAIRKHVLFILHGMGVYVDDQGNPSTTWADGVAAVLKEKYQEYPSLRTEFDKVFEVVPLEYDSVLHQIVKRWDDEAQKIANAGIEPAEIAVRMVDWLQGASDLDDNFHWTHVGDVVLYRFFNLVRQRVKVHVAKQVQEALMPNGDGAVVKWSLIAHSLGTIVAHDVLHAMNSASPNEAGISILDAQVPKPNLVAMLANVSKTLENDVDVYDSVVHPPVACRKYLSANNRFDPFVMESLLVPESFKPQGSPNWVGAIDNGNFIDVEIDNVNEINTHSARNYLLNPAVHIPMLEALCGVGSVANVLKQRAVEEFVGIPDQEIKDRLDELLDEYRSESWYQALGLLLPRLEQIVVGG